MRRQIIASRELLETPADQHEAHQHAGDADTRVHRHHRRRRPLLRRGRRLSRQARHEGVLRRHGHREQRRQQQLPDQRRGRRGDGAADERHLGRGERRRSGDERRARRKAATPSGSSRTACSPTTISRARTSTDELRARGLQTANKTVKIFDEAVSVGGPIKQDKLWFFGACAHLGHGAAVRRRLLEQDAERAADAARRRPRGREVDARGSIVRSTVCSGRWEWYDSFLGRLTWQAHAEEQVQLHHATISTPATAAATTSSTLQEAGGGYRFEPNRFMQGTYNSPLTSRLLLEAGVGRVDLAVERLLAARRAGAEPSSITDVGLGMTYGAVGDLPRPSGLHEPLHAARGPDLRHRIAHDEDRASSSSTCVTDNYFIAERQRAVHVPERRAASASCSARRRISSWTAPTSSASSPRISGGSTG